MESQGLPFILTVRQHQLLMISGDIHLQPGPTAPTTIIPRAKKQAPSKCPKCVKGVQKNHEKIMCEKCFDLIHRRCAGTTVFNKIRADQPGNWICSRCMLSELPFHGYCDLDISGALIESSDKITLSDEILKAMQSKSSQLKLMHLNTQSMLSTFNEFALIVNKYPLDLITLSETWMKDNKDLLEYVSFPGFSREFRNRDISKAVVWGLIYGTP